jgi:cytoskeleton protein RodZ
MLDEHEEAERRQPDNGLIVSAVQAAAGPGHLLRSRREHLGLDIHQVAASLHLRPEIVKALEEDRQDMLPPSTFVRGYLRAYAELLKLSAAEVVAAYENLRPQSAPEPLPMHASAAEANPGKRAAAIGIGILAVILLIAWWLNRPQPPQFNTSTSGAMTRHERMPAQRPEVASPPVSPDAKVGATTPSAAEPKPAAQPAPTSGLASKDLPAAGDSFTLQLSFREDCWVSIKDAKGAVLLRSLAHAGSTQEVHGVAPMQVRLGNAPAVDLKVNGQPYPLQQQIGPRVVANIKIPS